MQRRKWFSLMLAASTAFMPLSRSVCGFLHLLFEGDVGVPFHINIYWFTAKAPHLFDILVLQLQWGCLLACHFHLRFFFFKFLWLPSHFTKWFYHQMVNSNGNVFKENNLSLPLGKVCFYTTCIFSISLEMRIVYYKCIIFFFQNMSAWLDFEWVSK